MSRNPLYDALCNLGDSPSANTQELARRYQILFASVDGQLILEDLKQKCFFYQTTETDSESDKQDRINEGNRQTLLYILMMISIDTTAKQEEYPETD